MDWRGRKQKNSHVTPFIIVLLALVTVNFFFALTHVVHETYHRPCIIQKVFINDNLVERMFGFYNRGIKIPLFEL